MGAGKSGNGGHSFSKASANAKVCAPTSLLLAPTRLALSRIATLAKAFLHNSPIRMAVACGGVPIEETMKTMTGATLLLATPSRMLDLLEKGCLDFSLVRRLALADADEMLEMGFEPAVLRVVLEEGMCAPQERSTVVSCASLTPSLSALLSSVARQDLVRIEDNLEWRPACLRGLVSQHVCFAEEQTKQSMLASLIAATPKTPVLVVANSRRSCEAAAFFLREEGVPAGVISGERLKPKERDAALQPFLNGSVPVLVVTEGALKPLELPAVGHVISYDFPETMQEYASRLSRTGRSGRSGKKTTIVSDTADKNVLRQLAQVLQATFSEIPRWLEGLLLP